MKHFLLIILSVIITDFYYFPIEFVFFPGINTKMVLAGCSIFLVGIKLARNGMGQIDKGFFWISLSALSVSLASFIAIVVNNTFDYSFTGYIISMWVWLGGAYAVIEVIKKVHGKISVPIICNYLIAVCVAQCIIAYTMNIYPPMRDWVDSLLGGEAFMSKSEGRLYGIGAALDVAGLRFAAVLAMIAYLIANVKKIAMEKYIGWYIAAFLIIGIIGNMISRTATMGILVGIVYWIYVGRLLKWKINVRKIGIFIVGGVLFIGCIVYLYKVDVTFRQNLRFGFEGFFSLFETGRWGVHSNDILLNHMIRFPETWKTWIIGDGYSANPLDEIYKDPYYIGPTFHGYYMATDIGYLRFLFYFGIIGLAAFVSFFLVSGKVCMIKFPNHKALFVLLLLMNFIGWLKVATDIFLIFAPFLCLSQADNDESEKRVAALQEII